MDELTLWLDRLGLAKYAPVFREQEIDLDVLAEINEADMAALGLPLGPRRKILRALASADGPEAGSRTSFISTDEVAEEASAADRFVTERKQVTVLFADIVGSTGLVSALDPEDARERLRPGLDAMTGAVHRYEGTVTRVQGDGIIALFGAPVAQEDHATRACRAALLMQRNLAEKPVEGLRMRVGLHSGEVLVHAMANDLTVDYEAVGPSVHLASRLEALAVPGQVMLSGATRAQAGATIEARSGGLRQVKGIDDAVEVFELRDAHEPAGGFEDASPDHVTALAGRASELEVIGAAAVRAASGRGQALLIVGEAGVGKSRLLREAVQHLAEPEWHVVKCATAPFERHTTYFLAGRLLRSALRIDRRASGEALVAEVDDAVRTLDPALEHLVPALLHLLGLSAQRPQRFQFDPPQQHRLAIDALRQVLLSLSARTRVALLIEDLHWIDPGSAAMLDALVNGLGSVRMLVLMSARPGFEHAWAGRSWFGQVPLAALDRDAAGEMLGSLLASGPAETGLADRLVAHTGGIPLFIEETVRALADTGGLSGVRGSYRVSGPVDAISIPATVQAVIAARIDRLRFESRALLQAAAVVGPTVPVAVLEPVVADEQRDVATALTELIAAELLIETCIAPREFAFRHALIQEVAYRTLPRDRRRNLHARVGTALEALGPERLDPLVEIAAEHYRRGERWDRAVPLALRAARKAKDRFAYDRALILTESALECAARLDDGAAHLVAAHNLRADLLSLKGERDGANQSYEQARSLCSDPDLKNALARRYHHARIIARDGARLAYYTNGAGPQTILFVVPVAYDLAMFQPTIESLCDAFRLVTFDPRGNGRSDPVPASFTFTDTVEDLRAVVEDLDAGPVHLVGQSRGATISLRFAERYPNLAESLVLIGIKADRGSYGVWRSEFEEALLRGEAEPLVRTLYTQVFTEPETLDVREQVIRTTCAVPTETLLSFFRTFPDFDARDVGTRVQVPTLVVHGTDDRNTPSEDGKVIARVMPNARYRPFPGRGHLPNLTARAEFCEVLSAFVRGEAVPGVEPVR